MKAIDLANGTFPIDELQAHAAEVLEHVRDGGGPIVITDNGLRVGVLVSPQEYDQLTYRERFIAAVEEGIADVEAGRVISDEELTAYLAARTDR